LQQFSREGAQTKIEVQNSPEGRKHRLLLMLRRRRGLLRVRLLEMVVREERHGEGEVRRQERTEPPRGKGAGQRERERWAFWGRMAKCELEIHKRWAYITLDLSFTCGGMLPDPACQ